MKRLEIPDVRAATLFDTYKQCPALLGPGQIEVFNLPLPKAGETAAASASSKGVVCAVDAETQRRSEAARLVPLFGGALVALPDGSDVIVRSLSRDENAAALRLACGAHVVALVLVQAPGALSAGQGESVLVASTVGGGIVVLAVASSGEARLVHRFGLEVAEDHFGEAFVVAAISTPDGSAIHVLAQRAVRGSTMQGSQSHMQVLAFRLNLTGEKLLQPLGLLRGLQPVISARFVAADTALLVSESVFEVATPTHAQRGAKQVAAGDTPMDACSTAGEGSGSLTLLRLGVGADASSPPLPTAESWELPRGDVLAAWPEDGDSPADSGLGLAISDGSRG
ncbi:unnamed protein product, partial [Polarella glacialis]